MRGRLVLMVLTAALGFAGAARSVDDGRRINVQVGKQGRDASADANSTARAVVTELQAMRLFMFRIFFTMSI